MDPAPPARPLPAAQGHQGPSRGERRRRPDRAPRRADPGPAAPGPVPVRAGCDTGGGRAAGTRGADTDDAAHPAAPDPAADPPAATTSAATALIEAPASSRPRPAPTPAAPAVPSRPHRPTPSLPPLPATTSAVNPLDAGPSGVSFTLEELAEAIGAHPAASSATWLGSASWSATRCGGDTFYDGDALVVARTAAGLHALRDRGPPPADVQGGRRAGGRASWSRSSCRC